MTIEPDRLVICDDRLFGAEANATSATSHTHRSHNSWLVVNLSSGSDEKEVKCFPRQRALVGLVYVIIPVGHRKYLPTE